MKTDLQLVHKLRYTLKLSETEFADYLTIDREYMHRYFRGWVKMEPSFAEILAVVSKTPTSQWMYLASMRKTGNYTPDGIDGYLESKEHKTKCKTNARNKARRRSSHDDNRCHDKRVRRNKRNKRNRW